MVDSLVGQSCFLGSTSAGRLKQATDKPSNEMNQPEKILENIEELFNVMRPRHVKTPSMCGRYPCWIVWLPKTGTCERKSLKDALIECQTQIDEIDGWTTQERMKP